MRCIPDNRKNSFFVFALLLFSIFVLSSCSRIQGKLLIMEGNFFSTRGLYTQAISSYLQALNHEGIEPFAQYGLAAVYFALGESSSSLSHYRASLSNMAELGINHRELRFRIYYNMGIIYFEEGNYYQAVNLNKRALLVDGSRIEAKRNLELSLLLLVRSSAPEQTYVMEEDEEGLSGLTAALFSYARQMEREQWRIREWQSEDDWDGADF